MDLLDALRALAQRVQQQSDRLQTEEATKNALVLPFLRALGYDVFDPSEVMPGPSVAAGLRHRDRVDFMLQVDGRSALLLECRPLDEGLEDPMASQLYWCYGGSSARIGVLTNGVLYRFYSDLDQPGVLDEQPFFEFNLLAFRERDLEELKRFGRGAFHEAAILGSAAEQKAARDVYRVISEQMVQPSPAFLQAVASLAQVGPVPEEAQEAFGRLVRRSFQQVIADRIQERLKATLAEDDWGTEAPFIPTQRLEPLPESEAIEPLPVSAFLSPENTAQAEAPSPQEGSSAGDDFLGLPTVEVPPLLQSADSEAEEAPQGGGRTWLLGVAVGLALLVGFYSFRNDFPHHPVPPAVATATPSTAASLAAPSPVVEATRENAPALDPTVALQKALGEGDLKEASRLSQGLLAAVPGDHWTLRVAIAFEASTVKNLLDSLQGQEGSVLLRPIHMKDGRECFQVFLGDYVEEWGARRAAAALPKVLIGNGNSPKLFKFSGIPDRQE